MGLICLDLLRLGRRGDDVPGSPTIDDELSIRPRTRLQSGICKVKYYTDGTVKYNFLTTSGEPRDLEEALSNKDWKNSMDLEFQAL